MNEGRGRNPNQFTVREFKAAKLTPELAEQKPTLFKGKLINSLGEHHDTGPVIGRGSKAAWSHIVEKYDFSINKLKLDTKTWVSSSRVPESMTLGLGEMPEEMRDIVLFDQGSFTPETELLYRFSHEMSHPIGAELSGASASFNSLYTTAVLSRSKYKKGFSGLGSLDFYGDRGPETQAKEDVTELLNMYLWKPEYLKQFLAFLSDSSFKAERDRIGLITLDENVSKKIYDIVQNAVKGLLE